MCGYTATVEEDHQLLKSTIDKHLAFALSLKATKILTCQEAASHEDRVLLLILHCAKIGKGRIVGRSLHRITKFII